jgi:hypothetical protein
VPRAIAVALAALLLTRSASASGQADVQPAPCETADEVEARVRYERALRAWLDGRPSLAIAEANAGLTASPNGRFAQPLRALQARIESGQPAQPGMPPTSVPNARAEMIAAGTVEGLAVGILTAAALETDAKPGVALAMAGTTVGLVASVFATSGQRVRPAYPQMFTTGGLYGAFGVLMVGAGLSDFKGNIAGPTAVGVVGGSLLGLGAASAFHMTGGDASASNTGFVFGAGVPVLVELAALGTGSGHDRLFEWTALAGGTAGLLLGPALNNSLNWSRGRWSLIALGGGVGALFGLGGAVLVDQPQPGYALIATGALLGLGVSAFLTAGFDADEPREVRSHALLDVSPSGSLSVGSLTDALHPAVLPGRNGKVEVGAALALVGGSF